MLSFQTIGKIEGDIKMPRLGKQVEFSEFDGFEVGTAELAFSTYDKAGIMGTCKLIGRSGDYATIEILDVTQGDTNAGNQLTLHYSCLHWQA